MTLMVPSGGLEGVFPRAPDLDWSLCPWGRYRNCCNFLSLTSCSRWFHSILQSLVVLAMKALVAPQKVSTHSVRPLEVWLVFYLFQNLMHRFSKHNVNRLRSCRLRLPSKIPLGSVIVVTVRLEIPPLLRDNLALSLAFLLVLFNPLILVNSINELAYTDNRLPSQRFP